MNIKARLTATLTQLAWYIERDGWRPLSYTDRGSRGVARTYGAPGWSVTIEPEDIPELDQLRDRVYNRLHERGQR